MLTTIQRVASTLSPVELRSAVEALYATGFDLHQKDRYSDASTLFRLMLQLAPSDERCWLALGECHRSAGHLEVACELLAAGMVVANPAPRCAFARALCLRELGRGDESEDCFAQALQRAGDDLDLCLAIERTWRQGRV